MFESSLSDTALSHGLTGKFQLEGYVSATGCREAQGRYTASTSISDCIPAKIHLGDMSLCSL